MTVDISDVACNTEFVDIDIRKGTATSERLHDVVVRPIEQDELSRWLDLMRAHHYLGFGKSAGKRILYVATIDGKWVALLAWAAAALHVRCRDQWIGWDKIAKRHRLQQVTNNTRFLVLPGTARPNLASRVLALNLRRIRDDWRTRHGYEILLAETFVDPTRFRGTCYIAQGWINIGRTTGFGHHPRGGYQHHGCPKEMFIRPLVRDAIDRLRSPLFEDDAGLSRIMVDISKLPFDGDDGLFEAMLAIPSVRKKRCARHPQFKLLAMAACAMLSGARSHHDIIRYMRSLTPAEMRRLCFNPAKLPSRWTFWRVLSRLDANTFDTHVSNWLARVRPPGSARNINPQHGESPTPLPLLAAFLHG